MESVELRKKFTLCESPRYITNRYSHELIKVDCGNCPACLLSKASKRSYRCNLQQSLSKYCYFVTLTYSSMYLPKANINLMSELYPDDPDLIDTENWDTLYEFKVVPRIATKRFDFHDEEYSFRFISNPSRVAYLKKQCDGSNGGVYPQYANTVPYLNYADYQYFAKRLRKYIYTDINKYEKIHSFVVGEYGPVHFRPHFHLLLFFDSPQLSQNITRYIRKAWRFGNSDVESARNGASSYVASYVNSRSILPSIFTAHRKISIFSRFSNHFAQSVFEKAFEKTETRESSFLDGVQCVVSGKLTQVRPWGSCLDRFYPRFEVNVGTDVFKCQQLIATLSKVDHYLATYGYIGEMSVLEKSRLLFNLISQSYANNSLYHRCNSLLSYIFNSCRLRSYVVSSPEQGTNAIYRLLTKYSSFCRNWLKIDNYSSSYYSKSIDSLLTIQQFYRKLDYNSLSTQLTLEIEYFNTRPYTLQDHLIFCDLSDPSIRSCTAKESLYSNALFLNNRGLSYVRFENSVKHKKKNDKNRIFNENT